MFVDERVQVLPSQSVTSQFDSAHNFLLCRSCPLIVLLLRIISSYFTCLLSRDYTTQHPSTISSPLPHTRALDVLKTTLSQYYRISIQDGRIFIGVFTCIDKGKNIILTNSEEYKPDLSGVYPPRGTYGRVLFEG